MSLHKKSRDLLFKDYINRSYQGSKEVIKRTLLKIRPDEILLYKKNFEYITALQKKIIPLFEGLSAHSFSTIEKAVLNSITKAFNLKAVFYFKKEKIKGKDFYNCTFFPSKSKNKLPMSLTQTEVQSVFKKCIDKKSEILISCSRTKDTESFSNKFPNDFLIYFIKSGAQVSNILIFNKPIKFESFKAVYEQFLKQYLILLVITNKIVQYLPAALIKKGNKKPAKTKNKPISKNTSAAITSKKL